MGRLSIENKKILYVIERERCRLKYDFDHGEIVDEDIFNLINNFDLEFLLKKDSKINYKENLLRKIFNSPFLLCDQENMSKNMKLVLPIFLDYRYNQELEELNYQYKLGFMEKKEYESRKKELFFAYYMSSKDGRNIIKTGKAVSVKEKNYIKSK